VYVGPGTGANAGLSIHPVVLFMFVTVVGAVPIVIGYSFGDAIGNWQRTESRRGSGALSFISGIFTFVAAFLASKAMFESGMYGQRYQTFGFWTTIVGPIGVAGITAFAIALIYRKPHHGNRPLEPEELIAIAGDVTLDELASYQDDKYDRLRVGRANGDE
jgi:hypothetical protein